MSLDPTLSTVLGPGRAGNAPHLAAVHVSSDQFAHATDPNQPERILHRLLKDATPQDPAHVFVHGETGEGKSSLIYRAIAEVSAETDPPPSTMVLRCGHDIERLNSVPAFAMYMVDELLSKESFASIEPAKLAKAAISTKTVVPAGHGLSVAMTAGFARGAYDWKKASTSYAQIVGVEERAKVLRDQLNQAADRHERMIVVIDDTNRFATQGPDGRPDLDSVAKLFRNGLGFLIELPVSVVVAVHSLYRDHPAVQRIRADGVFSDVEVFPLPLTSEEPPLAAILDRRLEYAGRRALKAVDLFDREALRTLQAVYFAGDARNMRDVLTACKDSYEQAVTDGQERVRTSHAERALQRLPRSERRLP